MLIVDGFATFFRVLVIIVGILTVLLLVPVSRAASEAEAGEYLRAAAVLDRGAVPHGGRERADHDLHRPRDLLDRDATFWPGYLRDDKRNNESALKYFLLGLLRDGIPAVRGRLDLRHRRGSTNLVEIRDVLDGRPRLAESAGRAWRPR